MCGRACDQTRFRSRVSRSTAGTNLASSDRKDVENAIPRRDNPRGPGSSIPCLAQATAPFPAVAATAERSFTL